MITYEVVASVKTAFPSRNIRTISTSLNISTPFYSRNIVHFVLFSHFESQPISDEYNMFHTGGSDKTKHVSYLFASSLAVYLISINTLLHWYISNESKQNEILWRITKSMSWFLRVLLGTWTLLLDKSLKENFEFFSFSFGFPMRLRWDDLPTMQWQLGHRWVTSCVYIYY